MAKKGKNKGDGGDGEKNQENNNNNNNENNNAGGGGEVNIVLKLNLHCHGCKAKITKCLLKIPGVLSFKFEGDDKLKIVANGSVDVEKLKKNIEQKTGKKVEIVSPQPKKENDKNKTNNNNNNKDDLNKPKEKELPVTNVVLKVAWHCHGCGEKIRKAVSSYKGVYEVNIDKDKDLVKVRGKIDSKKLVDDLKEKLKRAVEIVPEKKDKKDNGGSGDGGNGGGGGGNGGGGGGNKAEEGGCGAGGKGGCTCRVHNYVAGSGYGYVDGFPVQVVDPYAFHTPQLFSDENPNACFIM